MRLTVVDFTSKKLALSFIAHEFVNGHRPPPTSTSHPQNVIHMIHVGVPRASPFFVALPLPCKRKLKNKKKGGGLEMRLAVGVSAAQISRLCRS